MPRAFLGLLIFPSSRGFVDHAKSSLGLVICRRLHEQWISHGVLQWWSQSNAHWGMEKYIFNLQLLPVLFVPALDFPNRAHQCFTMINKLHDEWGGGLADL